MTAGSPWFNDTIAMRSDMSDHKAAAVGIAQTADALVNDRSSIVAKLPDVLPSDSSPAFQSLCYTACRLLHRDPVYSATTATLSHVQVR